jgi:tetratricopeptide (TPR) repeat protein
MAKSDSRSKKKTELSLTWRQILPIAVVALILLGAAGYGGWRWLQGWRYDRAIRDAQDFMRLGDPRSAVFAAKRAAQARGDSVDAAKLLAEALEKTGSIESVLWRRKVTELLPGDWREQIALAASAVRFGDAKLARTFLEKVDAAGREHIDFHRTAADIALALRDDAVAETHLTEILRLDPYDRERKLKLAMLRIESKDAAVAAEARTTIEELKDDPALRLIALRVLLNHATKENLRPTVRLELSAATSVSEARLVEDPRLARIAEELLADENATLTDCMTSFAVLSQMRGTDVAGRLDRFETAKFRTPADLGDAMLWLNGRGHADRTVSWSDKLPDAVRQTPEVQIAVADAYVSQKEWGLVQAVIEETTWGNLEAERLVLSSIAWRIWGDAQRADTSWNLADLELKQDAARIRRLADFCVRWGAEPEKEKLWWKLASCPGDQTAVLKKLFTLALQRKDGAGLYRAVKGLYLAQPEDAPSMNNYAWLSLLRKEDLETAHSLAERVHAQNPQIGAYASTYAYSRHMRGRTAEGVQALEALPARALQEPTVAGCYGYLLEAAGEAEKAQPFIGIARRSPDLLPEEARLFLGSGDRIDRSLEVPELQIFSDHP